MSDVTSKDKPNVPGKPPGGVYQIPLTRGALYLLEFLFQDLSACTNPDRITKYGQMWSKIRKCNDRRIQVSWMPELFDFEKAIIANEEDISDIAMQKRAIERDTKKAEWDCQDIIFECSEKQRDLARTAISEAATNKKLQHRSSVGFDQNHTLILLTSFGFGE